MNKAHHKPRSVLCWLFIYYGSDYCTKNRTVKHFLSFSLPSFLLVLRSVFGSRHPRSRTQDHTQTHTVLGRTPLKEGSARRRDLYLTTLNNHNRKTYMFLTGFEPAIPARERPQTHALDRAATGSSTVLDVDYKYHLFQKKTQ